MSTDPDRDRELEHAGELFGRGRPTHARHVDSVDASAGAPRLVVADEDPAVTPPWTQTTNLRREEIYDRPVVDGRVVSQAPYARFVRWLRQTLTSQGEREEQQLITELLKLPRATRPNIVPIMSPKGGVGKTSMTFLVGSLLARLGHEVIAVDSNPDSGTLGKLVHASERSDASLSDLLEDLDSIPDRASLGRFVSRLSSGLDVLAGARDPRAAGAVGQTRYLKLVEFLSRHYEIVLLDLGTGISEPIPQFALSEAHQVLLVMTPDYATLEAMTDASGAVADVIADRPVTVALNKIEGKRSNVITENVQRKLGSIGTTVALPMDEQLRLMLDSTTYTLDKLNRPTRLAIRRLGLEVGRRIV